MRFQSSKELYEKIWDEKIESKNNLLVNRQRRALEVTELGNRCLDIGCGDGLFSSKLMSSYEQVYGMDGSAIALQKMKTNGGVPIRVDLDGGYLPIVDESFDLVACLDVIEHVFDPLQLISEMHRVLRRGGFLILTTPNIRFIDHIRSIVFEGQFPKTSHDKFCYDGGHIHYFTFKDIRQLLEKAGFNIAVERGFDEKRYRSPKTTVFRFFMRFFEKDVDKELFCPGILFKAKKIS